MTKKILTTIVVLLSLVLGAQAQNKVNGHEYVDLGLPSGTLWATEEVNKNFYDEFEGNYYNVDFGWGNGWMLPTESQFKELYDNCYTHFDTEYFTFVSKKNGSIIKFPVKCLDVYNIEYSTNSMWSFEEGKSKLIRFIGLSSDPSVEWANGYKYFFDVDENDISCTTKVEECKIRPVVKFKTISDVPDGWRVTGKAPIDGKVSVTPDGTVKVTPINVPLGKKVKSIKLVPVE